MTTRIQSKPHPHAALPDSDSGSLISDARLVEIYTAMLQCRILRERIRSRATPAKLRASTWGSEAVAAAAVIGLLPEDIVLSPAPHLFAALIKGVPLAKLLRPLHARASAKSGSDVQEADISSGVLDASFASAGCRNFAASAIAAGAAFAGKAGDRNHIAVVFHQDTGTEEFPNGVFDFALAHNLPVIFVRQSAQPLQPSVRRRSGKSAKRSTSSLPGSLPKIPVDSNDAVAIYRVAHEAIAHARRGSGPTLVDCIPVHLAGERKQDSDCIIRMERYLAAKGLRPERIKAGVTAKFTRALDAAVAANRRVARSYRQRRHSGKSTR